MPSSLKEHDRSFTSSSQRHDLVGSRVWLVSQCWLQGEVHGIEEARSQPCTSYPEARESTHQAETDPGRAQSSSPQQKGTGALEGSTAPLGQTQWTKSCLGSHQPGTKCLALPMRPWSDRVTMGHPPHWVDPPAGSPHACDVPRSSLRRHCLSPKGSKCQINKTEERQYLGGGMSGQGLQPE